MSANESIFGNIVKIDSHIDVNSTDITNILVDNQDNTVIFQDINGKKAIGNLFSTREKIASALNVSKNDIMKHILYGISSPHSYKITSSPEFRRSSIETDLTKLPIPKYFPNDGGHYITAGVIITEYKGIKNVSFHRMMVIDKDKVAVRLVPRHLFTIYNMAKNNKEELNISICVGTKIEVLLAAATSVDFGYDELEIASSMCIIGHKSPLIVGRCDNGILVPSDTDFVMEGHITLEETIEGPFVDITGTYDFERQQPIIKIDKIWTKEDPIFHLILPGGAEHFMLMGLPRESIIFRTVRQVVPMVKNVRLTEGGCCWLNGIVSISKNKDGDGINAIMAAFTGHTSMKQVIIVDDDIDIFNDREVEWAVATRMQGNKILIIPNAAGSSLDPSSEGKTTYKIGYDATIPVRQDMTLFKRAFSI